MKVYIFSYNVEQTSQIAKQLDVFVSDNRFVSEWSAVYSGLYFIKSNAEFKDLWESFHRFLDGAHFVMAEINPAFNKTNGLIKKGVWTWLTAKADQSLNALLPYIEHKK